MKVPSPLDEVQRPLAAVFIQQAVASGRATMDLPRLLVEIPTEYDSHRISVLPVKLRARGLIRQFGPVIFARKKAKSGKGYIWGLDCSPFLARQFLATLEAELGDAYPIVTKQQIDDVVFRPIRTRRKKNPPDNRQMGLFDNDN